MINNDENMHIPDSINKEGDTSGLQASKIKFYPEDIEKMKCMLDEQAIIYKTKLIEDGKYVLDWN